jgi:hypothetical protein
VSTHHDHHPNSALEDGLYGTRILKKTATVWGRLSASKFPHRFGALYGLILEFRSFYHRIRRLRKRGDICQPQMGPIWEIKEQGLLTPNRRTQARIQDMRQLLSSQPSLSPEDWEIFLRGWDAGWECCDRLGTGSNGGS